MTRKRKSPSSESALERARKLAQEGRYKDALRVVRAKLRGGEPKIELLLEAARLCLHLSRFEDARRFCQQALSLQSNVKDSVLSLSKDAYVLLAHVYEREQSLDQALWALKQAAACDSDDLSLWLWMAQLHQETSDTKAAIRCAEEVLRRRPDEVSAHEMLAALYVELGRMDKVMRHCEEALKRNPKSLSALDLLAFAHLQRGSIDQALQVMSRLVHLAPADPFNRFKLATLFHQQGAYMKAMREYQRVLDLKPQSPLANEAKEAIEHLDKYQLEQVFALSMDDSVFRAKLSRDPVQAVKEKGFELTEASLEVLKKTDFSSFPQRPFRSLS